MPKMSNTDATINPTQDSIHALQNPAPARPLVILVNSQKEALISLDFYTENQPPQHHLQG